MLGIGSWSRCVRPEKMPQDVERCSLRKNPLSGKIEGGRKFLINKYRRDVRMEAERRTRKSKVQGDSNGADFVESPTTSTASTTVDVSETRVTPVSENGKKPKTISGKAKRTARKQDDGSTPQTVEGPLLTITKPLPRVLIVHTGGTLGMDPRASYESDAEGVHLKKGTGGSYGGLRPGDMLTNLFHMVPELTAFANINLQVAFNKDSCRVGPRDWIRIAKLLHRNRTNYEAFLVVHGTDTLAYTASALSLMLLGFRKPIVLTGSQLPLMMPRSDARQNLIDSITCATAPHTPPYINLQEVAVCFGGKLLRGNRSQKVNSSSYRAFESPSYPELAMLGVDVDWDTRYLLHVEGVYRPRFKLDPRVIRIPIVPGSDPRVSYGDLIERGVKGVVLETFGVGNMPDTKESGWLPWLKDQRKKGLQVYLASQCTNGPLQPELYRSGSLALQLGVEAGPQMTPECAVVKMMMCLGYPDIPLGVPLAGEI